MSRFLGAIVNEASDHDGVNRYSYLLGQTELVKHFVDIKVRRHASLGVTVADVDLAFAEVVRSQVHRHEGCAAEAQGKRKKASCVSPVVYLSPFRASL